MIEFNSTERILEEKKTGLGPLFQNHYTNLVGRKESEFYAVTDPSDDIANCKPRTLSCMWSLTLVLVLLMLFNVLYAIGGISQPKIINQGNRYSMSGTNASKEVTSRGLLPPAEWKNWN
ncbi:hypothetical protein Godav_009946 [Gossypium davidsonii]|uniref:Uncharacterized protein n=2 Tax=Gossypium TaxID=3633 RepID=A0A7J8SET0_GOSDV|nr:hypothetical protein [Gossypium davidsonii]